jgi:small subunit ribosomal protein S16
VSVKIRLKRVGTKRRPYYRIVVMDSRSPRDGRAIEEVGFYHPIEVEDKQISVKEERIKEWLEKGARPSDTVKRLLNRINLT